MITCAESWALKQPSTPKSDTVAVSVHDCPNLVPFDTALLDDPAAHIVQAGQHQASISVIELQDHFGIAGLLGCMMAGWAAPLLRHADLCAAAHVAFFLKCTWSYSELCTELSQRLKDRACQQHFYGLPQDLQSDVAKIILHTVYKATISEDMLQVLPPRVLDLAIRAASVRLSAHVLLSTQDSPNTCLHGASAMHFLSGLSDQHTDLELFVTVVKGDVSSFVSRLPSAIKRLVLKSCQVAGVKGVHLPTAFPDLDELVLQDCEFLEVPVGADGRFVRNESWDRNSHCAHIGVSAAAAADDVDYNAASDLSS